jgi:hypothetical protein
VARPYPPDRREVRPEHLLRAVLDDALVGDVLTALGTSATAVRSTLEHRSLEAVDDLDDEVLYSLGIDVETVLVVLNPPHDGEPDWQGRTLSSEARDVLVKALVESSRSTAPRVHAGHVLLGLVSCRDPVVAGTLGDHGIRARPTREQVELWGRRAG